MYTIVYPRVHTSIHACTLMCSRYEPRRVLWEGITIGGNTSAIELWVRHPRYTMPPEEGHAGGGRVQPLAYVVASEGRVLQGQQAQSCWLQ